METREVGRCEGWGWRPIRAGSPGAHNGKLTRIPSPPPLLLPSSLPFPPTHPNQPPHTHPTQTPHKPHTHPTHPNHPSIRMCFHVTPNPAPSTRVD
jgi:hypothetical protein